MQDSNKAMYVRFSLLCAALSVLAFVLLILMKFSWMIAIIALGVCVIGIVLCMKTMIGEKPGVLQIIALAVCALMLIAVLGVIIFSVNAPDTSSRLIDQLKDSSAVLQ